MKFFLSSLFSLLWLFSMAQSQPVTITTFNCEFLNLKKVHVKYDYPLKLKKADRVLWDSVEYRMERYLEACDSIALFLAGVNSDIYALTEVGKEEGVEILFKKLKALNNEYKYFAVADSKDHATGQSVAIFSKIKLKKIEQEIPGREFYVSEEDDPEEVYDTGVSKGMRAEFKFNDKDFIIYNVHFVSERAGHREDQKRVAQASIVRRHLLEDLSAQKNIIITGDLNDHRGQPTLKRIRGLDDIFGDFIQTGNLKYFDKDKYHTRWTHQFKGERKQIDHILLSLSVKETCKRSGIKAFTTIHENDFLSDHNALSVTLWVK